MVIIFFSGDFRQNSPALDKLMRLKSVKIYCDLWAHEETILLTINERVRRIGDYERDKDPTKFLLNIGDGLIPVCKLKQ